MPIKVAFINNFINNFYKLPTFFLTNVEYYLPLRNFFVATQIIFKRSFPQIKKHHVYRIELYDKKDEIPIKSSMT